MVRAARWLQVTYHEGGSYEEPDGFQSLQKELAKREGASDAQTAGRMFYLAVPPTVYTSVLQNIKQQCSELMIKGSEEAPSWKRVVVEKPFGKDLQSSEELACHIAKLFTEKEVYRIDHYLGKELSQVRGSPAGSIGACSAVQARRNSADDTDKCGSTGAATRAEHAGDALHEPVPLERVGQQEHRQHPDHDEGGLWHRGPRGLL